MKKILIAIICAVMLFPASVVNAEDANTEDAVITVYCANADGSVVFGNETFQLYRITDENDEIAEPYKAVEESEDRMKYATQLQKVIQEQKIQPDKEVKTSEDGVMSIDTSDGMYLVCGTAVEKGNKVYTPIRILLAADSSGDCYVKYEVSEKIVTPEKKDNGKNTDKTSKKQKKTNAKTGDQTNVIPYLIAGAAALAIIAVIARKGRKRS